jgi:hypothetical protein
VFYIRYLLGSRGFLPYAGRGAEVGYGAGRNGRGSRQPSPQVEFEAANQQDQLENTLKPLKPHLYEVGSPMDFRKALASILSEISRY